MTTLLVAAILLVAAAFAAALVFLLYADAYREQAEDEHRRIPSWVRALFDFLYLRRRGRGQPR